MLDEEEINNTPSSLDTQIIFLSFQILVCPKVSVWLWG
jgi:hypothetical protein